MRWFTLLEMVIAMTLLVIFISAVSILFSYMADNFISTQFIGKSYEKVQSFRASYIFMKSNNPKLIFETWWVISDDTDWFKLLAFANEWHTSWFIVWAYDLSNDKVVTGTNLKYSDYVLFTDTLDSSWVTAVQGNINDYLSSAWSWGLNIYKDIKLVKLWYEPLNSSDFWKLDLTIVSEYYKNYKDQPVKQFLTNNKLLTSFNISVVK
jgi:type II secretory pathway component PulJ